MNKILRVLAIAAAGIVIGSVASRFIKSDRNRTEKNERAKSLSKKEGTDKKDQDDDKTLETIDNCFI